MNRKHFANSYPNNLLVYMKLSGETQITLEQKTDIFQYQLSFMINGIYIDLPEEKQNALIKEIKFPGTYMELFNKYDNTPHYTKKL